MTDENRLLAERVMGWELSTGGYWLDLSCDSAYTGYRLAGYGRISEIWRPRTNIQQAMMLLDTIPTIQYYVSQKYGRFTCEIQNPEGEWFYSGLWDTKEDAIVEAALKAVKEE